MKLLLDTHIWLWSTLQPERLSRRVSKELMKSENELWLSAISVWELTILHRKRQFRLPEDLRKWVVNSMEELELIEAPLTIEVALTVPLMRFAHNDPADQLLAASAKIFDLTFVTADERLMRLSGIKIMPNR